MLFCVLQSVWCDVMGARLQPLCVLQRRVSREGVVYVHGGGTSGFAMKHEQRHGRV